MKKEKCKKEKGLIDSNTVIMVEVEVYNFIDKTLMNN